MHFNGGRKMLSSDVKILNVTGKKVWRWQLHPTLNFMQLTPCLKMGMDFKGIRK